MASQCKRKIRISLRNKWCVFSMIYVLLIALKPLQPGLFRSIRLTRPYTRQASLLVGRKQTNYGPSDGPIVVAVVIAVVIVDVVVLSLG